MGGSVTWVRVYNNSSCTGVAVPNPPTLSSPGNGASYPYNYDLTFQWNTSSGASEYLIEWWGGPSTTMQPCGWSSSTSCHIGTVAAGNTYYWHVKARNSAGESPNWSDTWSFTIQSNTAPDLVIQSISASPTSPNVNQQATFTVRVKNQGNANVTSSFYVDLYVDQQPVNNCSDTGTAYWSVSSLAAGATQDLTYTYGGFNTTGTHSLYAFADTNCYITESNDDNNILGPLPITVQQLSAPTLNSPANNTTFSRTSPITLSWNTVSGANQYYAEFWGGPNLNINSGWTTNISWAVGSQWGGTYQWRVKARNSSGQESGWSETRTLYIKYGTPPNLSATAVSSSQINLGWGASADAPGNIDGYRIYRGGTAINTVSSSTTTFNDTGLPCGTSYSYTVKAYKGSSESDASNTASATTQACPPSKPDLVPYPRQGRSDPVIASSITNTTVNNTLYAGQTVYFDWGYSNIGNADVNSSYYVDLYVDNQRFIHYPFDWMGVGSLGGFDDWGETWNQSGWHTVKLVVDPENTVAESDETNNTWTKSFYWEAAPPSNDDFNTPVVIGSMPYNLSLDTTGATQANDDPDLTACNRKAGFASVWYRYTPPANGTLKLDTKGSDYDTMLAVWTGNRGSLNLVNCNDDIGNVNGAWDQDSILTMSLSKSVIYYIEVSTFNGEISVAEADALSMEKSEISIQSNGGLLQLHATYTVPLPTVPVLASPTTGKILTDYQPILDWNDQTNTPDHYQIQVATASAFAAVSMTYDQSTTNSEFTFPNALPSGKIYYWRVRAYNGLGQVSAWSAIRNFKTGWLPPSSLNSPANGEFLLNKRPTLSWSAVANAGSYNVQISLADNFSTVQINATATSTSFTPAADLKANSTYYWRVRTAGTNGPSAWTEVRTFKTGNPPGIPILSAPASNVLDTTFRPVFKWAGVTAPAGTYFDH